MDNVNGQVAKEVKLQIIEADIIMWNNTRYQHEVRARAARIVDNKELEKLATDEVEKCLKMIDAYKKIKEEIVSSTEQ